MARKKKKRNRNRNALSLKNLPIEQIRKMGEQYLLQEQFQNALKCFKEILNVREDTEITQLLEQSYRGRIRELAGKSLTKEALAMLDVMEHSCGKADTEALRISLQLKVGNYLHAAKLFTGCSPLLEDNLKKRFEIIFGALLLVDSGIQVTDFHENSPVFLHYPLACSALQNFSDNKIETTNKIVRDIPFRSPYRDLRTLLTGYLCWPEEPEKASSILSKISSSSPYHGFVERLRANLDSPVSILTVIAGSAKTEQQYLCNRYGLSIQQFRCLKVLGEDGVKALELYRIVKKNVACFTAKDAAAVILKILPFLRDKTLDILPRHSEIPQLEKIRIAALAAEQDGILVYAVDFWDDYLEGMNTTASEFEPVKALVLRYQAKLMTQGSYEFSQNDILQKYLESLKSDPTHTGTWLKAANLAGKYFSNNEQYKIINDAVAQLPEDVNILLTAMRAAGRKGAHKKAGNLANKVLRLDPINISALDFLTESNLEHARKLTNQKKWELAEKELSKKDNRVKSIRLRGRRLICLGMICLLQKKEEGLGYITAGREENNTVFLGHLLTSLEARLFQVPARYRTRFDKELRQALSGPFEKKEFLRLINWLLSFTGGQWLYLKECSRFLKSYFSKGAKADWKREEGVMICQAFDRAEIYTPLLTLSETLLKYNPEDVHIRAYNLLAKYLKKPKSLALDHRSELLDLLDDLEDNGSFELADRLEAFLDTDFSYPLEQEDYDEDYDIFVMPNKEGKTKQEKKTPPLPSGKQLDLFDFLK